MPQAAMEGMADALRCTGVSVSYGDVRALADVSVGFAPGRIHAVVGQNGAGKTTFAQVCAGLVAPRTGQVTIAGRPIATGDVSRSRRAGIEMVHQSFALPPSFTVAEAMEYGATGSQMFTRGTLQRRWAAHLEEVGVKVRPGQRIRDLPVETQQGVEIARALVTRARVLILDEPTAVLSPEGVERLGERLRRLRQAGVTLLVILHKIREVMALAETVTVLRGGRLIEAVRETHGISGDDIARAIIGAEASGRQGADTLAAIGAEETPTAPRRSSATAAPSLPPVLSIDGLDAKAGFGGPQLHAVDLEVGAGEIVGIAGVEGNGQRTLVDVLAGLVDVESGTITLAGRDVTRQGLLERRRGGMRIVPFERNQEGLSLGSSLWRNWAARDLLRLGLFRGIRPAQLQRLCCDALKQWDVRFHSVEQTAGSLSGGNAQKTILAREVDADARLLIAAQPTRGLDIGATGFVWRSLKALRQRGAGVLLISSDLDELFDIADRVVVFASGRNVGEFTAPYDRAAIGLAMTGGVR